MRALLLAFAVYAAGGGSALAAAPQATIGELRKLSSELEYDRAVSVGRRLLLRGDLSDDQRVEGLWLLGSALCPRGASRWGLVRSTSSSGAMNCPFPVSGPPPL